MRLDNIADGVDEDIRVVKNGRYLHRTILYGPGSDTDRPTFCYIDSRATLCGQMASPKDLHQRVRILSASNGLKPGGSYLPSCLTNGQLNLSQLVSLAQLRGSKVQGSSRYESIDAIYFFFLILGQVLTFVLSSV
jgi:hypothetical protein